MPTPHPELHRCEQQLRIELDVTTYSCMVWCLSQTVGSRDEEGQTALHCASLHGHVECVEALLEAGIAPDTATCSQQR